ncbi:MAG: hypothetical protein ABSD31_10145 [Candidatus Binataceae bacterium]
MAGFLACDQSLACAEDLAQGAGNSLILALIVTMKRVFTAQLGACVWRGCRYGCFGAKGCDGRMRIDDHGDLDAVLDLNPRAKKVLRLHRRVFLTEVRLNPTGQFHQTWLSSRVGKHERSDVGQMIVV